MYQVSNCDVAERADHINSESEAALDHIVVRERSQSYLIPQSSIIRCEALSNYTQIFLRSGKKFLVSKCLKSIEHKLSAKRFLRIHAKHLVNVGAIATIRTSPIKEVQLHSGAKLPISRSKFSDIKKNLQS